MLAFIILRTIQTKLLKFKCLNGSIIQNINNKEHTATTTDVKTKIIYLLLLYKKTTFRSRFDHHQYIENNKEL